MVMTAWRQWFLNWKLMSRLIAGVLTTKRLQITEKGRGDRKLKNTEAVTKISRFGPEEINITTKYQLRLVFN